MITVMNMWITNTPTTAACAEHPARGDRHVRFELREQAAGAGVGERLPFVRDARAGERDVVDPAGRRRQRVGRQALDGRHDLAAVQRERGDRLIERQHDHDQQDQDHDGRGEPAAVAAAALDAIIIGQVATTIVVAQIRPGRNGRRT